VGICVVVVFSILSVWASHRTSSEYYIDLWVLIFTTVGFIVAIILIVSNATAMERLLQVQVQAQLIGIVLMSGGVLFFFLLLGNLFGSYVKDISKYHHDIYTSGETLTDQKIIILLSHHSIFYKNGIVTVVQSSDIKKLTLKPPH
jgi:hypothetical protein